MLGAAELLLKSEETSGEEFAVVVASTNNLHAIHNTLIAEGSIAPYVNTSHIITLNSQHFRLWSDIFL